MDRQRHEHHGHCDDYYASAVNSRLPQLQQWPAAPELVQLELQAAATMLTDESNANAQQRRWISSQPNKADGIAISAAASTTTATVAAATPVPPAAAMLLHPAEHDVLPTTPEVVHPGRLSVCSPLLLPSSPLAEEDQESLDGSPVFLSSSSLLLNYGSTPPLAALCRSIAGEDWEEGQGTWDLHEAGAGAGWGRHTFDLNLPGLQPLPGPHVTLGTKSSASCSSRSLSRRQSIDGFYI